MEGKPARKKLNLQVLCINLVFVFKHNKSLFKNEGNVMRMLCNNGQRILKNVLFVLNN